MTDLLAAAGAAWTAWVVPVSIHALALLALALVADRALRRRVWPSLLAALWLLPVARLLLPPGFGAGFGVAALLGDPLSGPAGGTAAAVGPGGGTGAPGAAMPWPALLLLGWATGAALLVVVSATRTRAARARLLDPRDMVPVPLAVAAAAAAAARRLGMARAPRLVLSRAAAGPVVLGVFRPVVLLPAGADGGADTFHALLHEFAHVRRGDPVARALLAAVRAAWWFHPAAWVAGARLDALREACCDATVASVLGGDAAAYRRTLVAAARALLADPVAGPAGSLGLVGVAADIEERFRAIDEGARAGAGRRRALAAAAGVVGAAVLLPGIRGAVRTHDVPPSLPGAMRAAVTATPAPPGGFRTAADPSADAGLPAAAAGAVLAARRVIAEALSEEGRPGCVRVREAGMVLLAAGASPAAFERSVAGLPPGVPRGQGKE